MKFVETNQELLSLCDSHFTSLDMHKGYVAFSECHLMKQCDTVCCKTVRKKNIFHLFFFRKHDTCRHTVYILFKVTEAQCATVFPLGVSFQECKCLGPRHSVIYLLIYLSTHLPVPLCLPVAHSSSLSASVSPMGPRTPPLALLCSSHTCLCAYIYTKHMHMHTEDETIQLHSLLQCLMLPSPCNCQLCWGPIIQSVHDQAQRSLLLEHQQSARCLCWIQNTVVVHNWKPQKVT